MAAVIRAEQVTRRLFGEITVTLVEQVSLEVMAGEFVVITGPSGSGKSSLLYLLALLDTPTSGRIWLNGKDTSGISENELADIRLSQLGFVFQFHFLLPEFSILENVMLPMQRLAVLEPQEIKARAIGLLGKLGLSEQINKYPRQLSGGQSQRVAIARAIANNPILIFADEPTGNLDTVSSAIVQTLLRELANQQNRAVVMVTHDQKFAESADRILTIVDGKLV